ncbi:hypothetical protein [Mesorhizobium abyssinicae]|uniref:hypothetical protein n=1 Tax=Mesorhizobium abyssinicae TaxID=1209958 RepID=UPI00339A8D0D
MILLRWLRRIVKTILWLAVIIVLIPVAGLGYGFLTTSSLTPLEGVADGAPPNPLAKKVRAEIPGYQQPRQATYLAYPYWTVVYAAHDYAGFVAKDQPSGFPYWSYIGRFWQGYATMIRASSGSEFNVADHRTQVVIGIGQTVELALQWAYENTVGRITEAIAGRRTATDGYQARMANEYAGFLDRAPWYQFPYAEKRAGLFGVQPAPGDGAVRSGERKLAFGLADTVKQVYAGFVSATLAPASDPAGIHVWAKGPVGEATRTEPDTLLERDFGSDGTVFVTGDGQLSEMIPRLIDKGVSFVEIGGNDEIMLTVLSPAEIAMPEGTRALFSYPLPTDPDTRRTGLTVAVRKLHVALPALIKAGARLEHVYDG